MCLRVYTLSSLHSLLCALSGWFSLVTTYPYADIYDAEWSAADEECKLQWPYPTPCMEHLKPKQSANTAASPSSEASQSGSSAANGTLSAEVSAAAALLSQPQRNWNRVFRVEPHVREQWQDVEAVVLVLRRNG